MQRKRWGRLAVVLMLAGGALYLLLNLPALAEIGRTTHTSVDDFSSGTFYLTGMMRQDDGEVTLLPIGVTGDWQTSVITGLPPLYGHAMVEHNGYVYVIGGKLSTAGVMTRAVHFSRINTQTHTLQPFTTTTPLPDNAFIGWPNGVFRHAAVVVGDFLYVMGGEGPDEKPVPWVWMTHFNADGSLGEWEPTLQMPGPRTRAPAVEVNGYIYLIGGRWYPEGGESATDVVWYTKQRDSQTGYVSEWATATQRLPFPGSEFMAVSYQLEGYPGRIYLLGGVHYVPFVTRTAKVDVFYTQPDAEGGDISNTGWISTVIMPTNLMAASVVIANGELIVLGGWINYPKSPPAGGAVGNARVALLNIETGNIITYSMGPQVMGWYDSAAIQPERFWHGSVVGPDNHIYVLGGIKNTDLVTDGMLNVGSIGGDAGVLGYANAGWYIAPPIEMGRNIKPLFFRWVSTMDSWVEMKLQYRVNSFSGGWEDWSAPYVPTATSGLVTTTVPFTHAGLQFQYRVGMTTTEQLSHTPVLRDFTLEYDVVLPPIFYKKAEPASGQSVLAGREITYTLYFTSQNKLSDLSDVVVIDRLPITMTFERNLEVVPGTITWTYNTISHEVWYNVGTLPPESSGRVSFVARVKPGAPHGALINQALFKSMEADKEGFTTHYVDELRSPLVTKTAVPTRTLVWPGERISYTVGVSNPNNMPLEDVVITDLLPVTLTWVAGSCQPTCTVDGNTLQWMLPTLDALGQFQTQFAAVVSSSAVSGTHIVNRGYAYGNIKAVGARTAVAASSPITHTVVDAQPPAITKQANPPSGQAVGWGDAIDYTLMFTNSAALTLTHAIVTDTLPVSMTLVSGCDAPDCVFEAGVLRWQVEILPPQQAVLLGFRATVSASAPVGTILTNTAYGLACVGDVCTDLAASLPVTHQVEMLTSARVDKSAAPPGGSTVSPGDNITYTLFYTSFSDVALQNVAIYDRLPAGLELLPSSCPSPTCTLAGGVLTWTLGTLTTGQSGQVRFVAQVGAQAADGAILRNTARIKTQFSMFESQPVTHTVVVPYDLVVSKSDGVKKADEGDTLTYQIIYTNLVSSGVVTLTGLVITDELVLSPSSPDWVAFLPSSDWEATDARTRVRQLGPLGPNQSRSLSLQVKVTDTLPISPLVSLSNRVVIGDDHQHGLEADTGNNQFVDTDAVRGADLVLRAIQPLPAEVELGGSLHVQADLANEGASAALSWEGSWYGVELYVKPPDFAFPGAPDGPHDHAGGFCATTQTCLDGQGRYAYMAYIQAADYPLAEGAAKTLVFDLPNSVHGNPSPFTQQGVYSIYLQADIGASADPSYGRVQETNEANNIEFLGTIQVTQPSGKFRVYLPLTLSKFKFQPIYIYLPLQLKGSL